MQAKRSDRELENDEDARARLRQEEDEAIDEMRAQEEIEEQTAQQEGLERKIQDEWMEEMAKRVKKENDRIDESRRTQKELADVPVASIETEAGRSEVLTVNDDRQSPAGEHEKTIVKSESPHPDTDDEIAGISSLSVQAHTNTKRLDSVSNGDTVHDKRNAQRHGEDDEDHGTSDNVCPPTPLLRKVELPKGDMIMSNAGETAGNEHRHSDREAMPPPAKRPRFKLTVRKPLKKKDKKYTSGDPRRWSDTRGQDHSNGIGYSVSLTLLTGFRSGNSSRSSVQLSHMNPARTQ